MNSELGSKMLRRKNMEDNEDQEDLISERRCSSSESSTLVDNNFTYRALRMPEILIHIIEYLPVKDCKNFRLVCKLWNEYCDLRFVFRCDEWFECRKMMSLFPNSSSRRIKLEFQGSNLRLILDKKSWEIFGSKVRSLHFYNCYTGMETETLQFIISNSVNLENLEICQDHHSEDRWLVVSLLDYFLNRKERRTRLRTLAVKEREPIITIPELLEKILTVFPCIVNLSIEIKKDHRSGEVSRLPSDRVNNLKGLKSFTILSTSDYLWSDDPVVPILDIQLLRLTKFKTLLYLEDFIESVTRTDRLLQFFTIQKDLEAVDLETTRRYSCNFSNEDFNIFIKSLIFHILRTCSSLREFQLAGKRFGPIKLTNKECEEFFSLISNLQVLKIQYSLEKEASETTTLSLSLPNFSLSVLQLLTEESLFLATIGSNLQLKHLCVDIYSDQQLREIIMAMTSLETLVLRLFDCTNYGFLGDNEESSIKRLRNLEYLYINDRTGKITCEVFDEFCFPRLEYLGLHFQDKNCLPETLCNMPALKTVELRLKREDDLYWKGSDPWLTEKEIRLLKPLKNLNRLIAYRFAGNQNAARSILPSELVAPFFKSIASLKYITDLSSLTYTVDGYTYNSQFRFINNKFFPKKDPYQQYYR